MNKIEDRLAALEEGIAELRRELAEQKQAEDVDVGSDPGVVRAAQALAEAVARAQGINMPLQRASAQEGARLPVLELPPEYARQGGIGIAVMLAKPPEGASQGRRR